MHPAIQFLGLNPKYLKAVSQVDLVFLTALSSIIMAIFNFQKMEATLVSITG
jgi:hypothetical protein